MKSSGILFDSQTNDVKINLVYDSTGKIASGLEIGDITTQNQSFMLISRKGDYKLSPLAGVGIDSMLNDNDRLHWESEITSQLKADGQTINKVKVTQESITIDAYYPKK